mmetsp:Transcript_4562/g.3292  ORF Transcript_4562/g.3292 Transcript_4562/m.3292 type:complete len:112 (+) Transcript_4562:1170-1505(+)|eukprot:CAMPEP_0202972474 /NCGR_PEP_ID=MMETSP1396-20130829/36898_1 /ASSEMBLY_ACC=CAM_ASM_000872 /TAXON_ID= /ORGANISM="Pseudokeronopsis sp., Strain Brazil" /LENGTH=111 /DNA_ID=CAMNT_0049702933 /DNA_START=1083 /DNA_END=1418 /DNA_ORIENTATION=-
MIAALGGASSKKTLDTVNNSHSADKSHSIIDKYLERFASSSSVEQNNLWSKGVPEECHPVSDFSQGTLRRTKTVTNLDINALKGTNLFEEKFREVANGNLGAIEEEEGIEL